MTEEQRMEEGRRMFQIFAARMFEQRVLNAYRQKVAEERQKKLIEELAEDEQLDAQREAKKAKEAQKKKEKRQKQKQARDEEKAKREAEKATAEAAARAIEEKKLEEQRQRKEEQRKKKEAERKAAEDEKKRKEEEKQRQVQERKEQQAELERKQREQKDREKKKREEAKKREREDREAREKEIRDNKERELAERRERESKEKFENNEKERLKQEALSKQAASVPKAQSPANASQAITPISSSLLPPHTSSSHASPRLPVATPVLPKAPTPGRVRQKSFQDSRTTSPKPSQPASSSAASPVTSEQQNIGSTTHVRKTSQPGLVQSSAQQPRFSPTAGPPNVISQPPGFAGMTSMASNAFPPTFGPPMSPIGQHTQPHHPPGFPNPYPFSGNHYRGNNIPYPPATSSIRQFPPSQPGSNGHPISQRPDNALTNNANSVGRASTSHDPIPAHTHSRNQSGSSNISPRDPNPRPAPIQRPSSVTPHQQNENARPLSKDVDDLSNHLGSSALLDDTDVAAESAIEDLRRGSMPVGGQRAARQGFGGAPGLAPIGTSARMENGHQPMNMWSNLQSPLGHLGRAPQPFASASGFGRTPNGNAFGSAGVSTRSNTSRALRVRTLVSSICDKWGAINPASQGWHVVEQVCGEMQTMMPRNEPPVLIMEVLQICDTEGNAQNGGGWFEWRPAEKSPFLMKHHTSTDGVINSRAGPPPGDIGSPRSGGGMGGSNIPSIGGQSSFQQGGRP